MDIGREDIVRCYCAETEEGLATAEEALVKLETAPGDVELLNAVFRAIHTIKGNSLSLGFSGVAEMAHAVEDRLVAIRDSGRGVTSEDVTVLLRGADALRHIAAAAVSGVSDWLDEHRTLLAAIRGAAAVAPPQLPVASERRRPGRRREDAQTVLDGGRTLRVDSLRLDKLLDLTGETAIARSRVRRIVEESRSDVLQQAFAELERLSLELQELVMRVRMVPVGPTFRQYLRVVRDLAVSHGKLARAVTEGDAVEIDLTVVEHLKEVLTHLVRNAIDHGIETPDERRAAAKDPCGTIALRARHEAGFIVIEVEDDGSGLDLARITSRARAMGRLADGAGLSADEARSLICEPGFSTRAAATDMSGRGVGLDVVRQHVDRLGGSLEVSSTPGRGTAFLIRVPLTLAVLDAFVVAAGGEHYLIPTDVVLECLAFEPGVTESGGCGVVLQRGEALPYARLSTLLHAAPQDPGREQLLVVRQGGHRFGLAVDSILGQHPAVIKPLGRYLEGLEHVSGCAVLDSGRVGLILDLAGLERTLVARDARAGGEDAVPHQESQETKEYENGTLS